MKRVFICSPYSGDIDTNTAVAIRLCRQALEAGHAPIAPHLLYPQMLPEDMEGRKQGIACGLAWLDVCDEVWIYAAGQITDGMWQEINHARHVGKPIRTVTVSLE